MTSASARIIAVIVLTEAVVSTLLAGCSGPDPLAQEVRFAVDVPSDVNRAVPGTVITFIAEGAGTVGRSLEWSLGDGTTKKGERIQHAYAAPGSYNVSLSNGVAVHSKYVGIWDLRTFTGTTPASLPPVTPEQRESVTHAITVTDRAICLCANVTGSDGVPMTSLGLEAVGPDGEVRARHGGDGPVFIEVTENLVPGEYTLYVWNERGGGPTDYVLQVAINYQNPR
jgi:hypothetical protein